MAVSYARFAFPAPPPGGNFTPRAEKSVRDMGRGYSANGVRIRGYPPEVMTPAVWSGQKQSRRDGALGRQWLAITRLWHVRTSTNPWQQLLILAAILICPAGRWRDNSRQFWKGCLDIRHSPSSKLDHLHGLVMNEDCHSVGLQVHLG